MSVIDTAILWACGIAEDDTHGYDQTNRWGVDYDCSSFIISAYKAAGVPLTCTYTGDMRGDMLRNGFADVTAHVSLSTGAGLRAGDVLLNNKHHTAMYIGNGKIVHASINERGTTTGGTPGDQTGREICERTYFNYPWDCVLRYTGATPITSTEPTDKSTSTPVKVSVSMPQVTDGDMGVAVAMLQAALRYRGYDPVYIDGEFGLYTHNMLMGFQAECGLTTDAICGKQTWAALLREG